MMYPSCRYVIVYYTINLLLFTLLIMACDRDMVPWKCLICCTRHMTLDDLEDHIAEKYFVLCERFSQDPDSMPDFRSCLACEANGAYYMFSDIFYIMYHIQTVHPSVEEDVGRLLRKYLWEAREDADS